MPVHNVKRREDTLLGAVLAKRPITSINTNTTITAEQTGTTFIVSRQSGGSGCVISLPATSLGLEYEFFILTLPTDSVAHALSPVAADKFIGLGLSGVDNKDLQHPVASDAIGDWVRIVGDGNDGWLIIGARGTFAIES